MRSHFGFSFVRVWFMKRPLLLCAMCLALLTGGTLPAPAQDWPSIRGPRYNGAGVVGDAVAATGKVQLKVIWKQPFGSGYSGVVKSGQRLISAMADQEAGEEFLVALDASTGKTLWRTSTGKIMKGENGSFDGPLATPAVDRKHAYHLSPFGDLAAYSLQDGAQIWSKNLKKEFKVQPNFYGFGASPIVHKGVLILAVGSRAGAIMGFECETGKVLWKAGNGEAAFQSPIVTDIAGKETILAASNTDLLAIDPEDGDTIWSQPHGGARGMPAWSVIPVPLPGGGVFLNDGRDGTTAVNLKASGAKQRWSGRDIRNSYCVPVMSGGLLCSYSSRFLVAVDPQTGKRAWRTRSPGDGFLATAAGRLVVSTIKGSLHLGDVTRDGFQEVAAEQVFEVEDGGTDGLTWSLPCVAGRSVFVRSLGAIARVDMVAGKSAGAVAATDMMVGPDFAAFLKRVEASEDKAAEIASYLKGKSLPLVEDEYVHFVLQGDYQDVAVASELFGVRQERAMQRAPGTQLFYYGVRLPAATRASYTFFADYQPMPDPLNKRSLVSSLLSGEMEPNFVQPRKPLTLSWFDTHTPHAATPSSVDRPARLAGSLENFDLQSAELKQKVPVTVYLPPGYKDSVKKYPVVFVHDGQVALEGGIQAAVLDELIRTKKVSPAVAVFIGWRFYPLQGAAGYPEMFAKELLPRIAKGYRVSDKREERSSYGSGFGATVALMASLPAGDKIGRMAFHSPFAFDLMHPMLKQLVKLPPDPCNVKIQWARYEFRNPSENWNMAAQSETLATMLKEAGHQVTATATADGTGWASWRKASPQMWQFLLSE